MVKERQPLHARCQGKVHGQLGRAMAPCQLARVLLQRVLRVVNHEVSIGQETQYAADPRGEPGGPEQTLPPRDDGASAARDR